MDSKFVIGLDYGSDSARAIVVNALTGETLATAVQYYPPIPTRIWTGRSSSKLC